MVAMIMVMVFGIMAMSVGPMCLWGEGRAKPPRGELSRIVSNQKPSKWVSFIYNFVISVFEYWNQDFTIWSKMEEVFFKLFCPVWQLKIENPVYNRLEQKKSTE